LELLLRCSDKRSAHTRFLDTVAVFCCFNHFV
jgi:hypothetical protein